MFSRRLPAQWVENRWTQLVRQKREAGVLLLDLTDSNPTRAQFSYPEKELMRVLQDPEALHYQPDSRGLAPTRQAIVTDYYGRDRGLLDATLDDLILTTGSSEAYSHLFKLLASPGETILVPRPSYPLFESLVELEGLQSRSYPLHYSEGWHLDLEELESLLPAPEARALVVVNPNNPTGSFLRREEWKKLQRLAACTETAVICDEVFFDYAMDSNWTPFDPVLEPCGTLTFFLNGLSKLAGLPQMKLGWILVQGPADWKEQALCRMELISDTFLSVSTPIQHAAGGLLEAGRTVREQIRQRIQANRSLLDNRCLHTQGGWTAVLPLPRIRSEEEWIEHLLLEQDVVVHPGYFYDFDQEAFAIVSLLTEPTIFHEGTRRLFSLF